MRQGHQSGRHKVGEEGSIYGQWAGRRERSQKVTEVLGLGAGKDDGVL